MYVFHILSIQSYMTELAQWAVAFHNCGSLALFAQFLYILKNKKLSINYKLHVHVKQSEPLTSHKKGNIQTASRF